MSRLPIVMGWTAGAALGATTALLPGSDPPLGVLPPMILAALVTLALLVHLARPRPGLLETALAAWLVIAYTAGLGALLGAALFSLALACTARAYFILRLDARARQGSLASEETRHRVRAVLAFGGRRITIVSTLAAAAAILVYQAPHWTAPFLGPRWGTSLDAASEPILAAVAFAFLIVTTAWILIRLGRAESAKLLALNAEHPAGPDREEEQAG